MYVGEKFREVMSNTFGLQNWRFFRPASQQSSQQSNQLNEMMPLQRLESECPPNILSGTYVLVIQVRNSKIDFNMEVLSISCRNKH